MKNQTIQFRIQENVFNYMQEGFPKHNTKELSIKMTEDTDYIKTETKVRKKIT